MSTKYVVGLSCTSVKEVKEHSKQNLYSFEITWSDESQTSKEVTSDDLNLLRKHLKTEVYKKKPEVVIPEMPDGKGGAFGSKARKLEKRKKNMDEFCLQIINLPHAQGKLAAIASPFETSTIIPSPSESWTDKKKQMLPVQVCNTTSEGFRMAPDSQPETEDQSRKLTPNGGYQEISFEPRNPKLKIPPTSDSKLNYVEVEFIAREKREPCEVSSPVYADIVFMKSLQRSDWLKGSLDPDDPEEEDKPTSIVPPHNPIGLGEETKLKAEEIDITEKAEVLAPEPVHEMSDIAESTPKRTTKREEGPGKPQQGLFDAAMMSNFPSRTLVPLPPTQTPEKCPASSDIKLSKKELPTEDVSNICIVAIRGRKSSGDSTLPFKRKQRAHLLYTTDLWWFITTEEAIGWVPADYWRIITHSKKVIGKALPSYAPWNFGVLGRVESEALLKTGNQSDFLVRESSNSTGHLVLSVKQNDIVYHFEIQITETGSYVIGSHHFKTIHNVILYYMKHPIFNDVTGIRFTLGRLFPRRKK